VNISEHEATKPVRSKALKDMTQAEYSAWSNAMSEWLWIKDGLIARDACEAMEAPINLRERMMREKACTPRADYIYRDIPKRKHRSKAIGALRERGAA
jgi:hypothetical protein